MWGGVAVVGLLFFTSPITFLRRDIHSKVPVLNWFYNVPEDKKE
jgi:hypothetical protein